MAGRLSGRRVLVVGGGQQDYGIEDPPPGNGRAMSVLLAREGAAVAVADLDAASAEATLALVREAGTGIAVTGRQNPNLYLALKHPMAASA